MKKEENSQKKIDCSAQNTQFVDLLDQLFSIVENTIRDCQNNIEDGKDYFVPKMLEILPEHSLSHYDNELGIFFGSVDEIVPDEMFIGELSEQFHEVFKKFVYLLMQIVDQDNKPFGGKKNDLVLNQAKFIEYLNHLKTEISFIKSNF